MRGAGGDEGDGDGVAAHVETALGCECGMDAGGRRMLWRVGEDVGG